jgi:two-component system, sensor histidine kinase RpfC
MRLIESLSAVRQRLAGRTDSEHEQAILRIVIVSLVLAYMGFSYSPGTGGRGHAEPLLVFGLAGDLILAIALFAGICIWPPPSIPRRATGMLADAGAATFCMFLAGESGVSMIGVYLFITFGNGFRYGRAYLFACQALCLIGFSIVLIYAPYWAVHRTAGWCLMIALVVLPVYVSTLLKRIQNERARAEEANRAKSSFLANMSHEMRTPLNGIVGVADLLQTTSLTSQQAELMRLLRHSVMLLRSLVDDVLDISKIESGRLTIEIADFDLHATLNGLIRLLKPHANAKGLALRAMVDPAIDYRLRGDSHHLRQVLLNLLSNAIKFTNRGDISVDVTLLAETDEGLRLRFEVCDTGIGISEKVQERIFERFVQADDSTTRRYGGTGLGTTIAKQLVELMGGAIGLKSALGEGSTFWFELPLLKTTPGSPLVASAAQIEASTEPTTAILIAEPSVMLQVAALVEAACGRVDVAASSIEALAQLRALKQQGIDVQAVIVCGDLDTACDVFEKTSSGYDDLSLAKVYLFRGISSDPKLERIRSMDGVSCLSLGISPRVLRNAIHAATTGGISESAEIIDLGRILQEQRQPLRILVAEDNVTNQTIISKLLQSAGHTVIVASDGEQALDLYEQGTAELAILDFNMPERNGLEVTTAIRTMESPETRLPIIILSASVTVEARERARQAGADEFVGKPFEAATLLQVIDRLSRRASRGQPQRPIVRQANTIALIDHARVQEVERISRDAAFLMQLLRGFRGDVESLLGRLDSAIAAGHRSAMTDIAHAIRGAALGIGAQQLAAHCAGIEEAAASGHITQLRTLATEIRRCFDATAAQLTDYTARRGASH